MQSSHVALVLQFCGTCGRVIGSLTDGQYAHVGGWGATGAFVVVTSHPVRLDAWEVAEPW